MKTRRFDGCVKACVLAVLLVASTLLGASSAWAAHPQERRGFWIGFGGGYGSASASCDGCDGDEREGSYTGFIKLGGTLNERLLLGVESNLWMKEDDIENATLTLGTFMGTVTFYPSASAGFFLKGGVGASFVDTDFEVGTVDVTVSKTGWGFLLGAGYDWRVGRNVSVTPCVNYHYGSPGDLDFEGVTLGNWKHDVISIEIGVTFH
jgi:hypothetical protein